MGGSANAAKTRANYWINVAFMIIFVFLLAR